MPLNSDDLLKKFAAIRKENGMDVSIASILKDAAASDDDSVVAGKVEPEVADQIVAKIEKLVVGFKSQKEFNWRVHVLDPITVILSVIKMIGDYGDRQYMENLVIAIIKDLYKQYTPKIPYIPEFIAKWVLNLLADKLVPWLVDWTLDLIYGEDEVEDE